MKLEYRACHLLIAQSRAAHLDLRGLVVVVDLRTRCPRSTVRVAVLSLKKEKRN